MKELPRLFRYVAPYAWAVALSAVLMAAVGGAHAMTALLVG